MEDAGAIPQTGQIIRGADRAARARGYSLLVVSASGPAESAAGNAGVESLLARRVDGFLYVPRRPGQLSLPLGKMPTVLVNAADANGSIPAVVPDEASGALAAVGCLRDAGHSRIGFIRSSGEAASGGAASADPATDPAGQGLVTCFHAPLAHTGPDGGAAPAESGPPNEPGGYAAAHRLLDREDRPTGLVCDNEVMAMGAYRAAAGLGLAIPADLSVVAFADQELIAANLHPALTTVTLSVAELGTRAAELLIGAIEGAAGVSLPASPPAVPAYRLITRGSVAPPGLSATPRGNF
jgi:LacI family transcriptional regulator